MGKILPVLAGALACMGAGAATTLDFNDVNNYCDRGPSSGFCFNNFAYQGMRFSPSNHWHPNAVSGGDVMNDGSNWLGWDASGDTNTSYLGAGLPAPLFGAMYIDNNGGLFSLFSLFGPLLNADDITVYSSKGGIVRFDETKQSDISNAVS